MTSFIQRTWGLNWKEADHRRFSWEARLLLKKHVPQSLKYDMNHEKIKHLESVRFKEYCFVQNKIYLSMIQTYCIYFGHSLNKRAWLILVCVFEFVEIGNPYIKYPLSNIFKLLRREEMKIELLRFLVIPSMSLGPEFSTMKITIGIQKTNGDTISVYYVH